MQFTFASLVLLATLACVYAENVQLNDKLESSVDLAPAGSTNEARFFFTTLTVTFQTTTSTSTVTTVSTCTTSTAALKTCLTSGRRRRGVLMSGKTGRGLFYNENEPETEEGSIFLPGVEKIEETIPAEDTSRVAREDPLTYVPFVVQPGFQAATPNARFLLAYSTLTVTTTTTAKSTTTMTAICSSITGFQLCGVAGK